jgi:hypothetical protein
MKKLIILSAIAISGLIYNTADAQIGIRVGFNFGPRRVYAPAPVVVEQTPVYNDNDYYYLPDVDAYYNVDEQCYYYYDGDNWISAAYLPGAYHDYDWRSERHFEVRANRPYIHNDIYRARYNGHAVAEWSHNNYNSHFDGGYANRGYMGNNQHFDNRAQLNNDRRYDDGGNRSNTQRYTQPVQPNRNQGNIQRFDNRGQGNFAQPVQPNRNQGNESRTDNRGQDNRGQDNRGGGDHYTRNNPQGGYSDHRMSRF